MAHTPAAIAARASLVLTALLLPTHAAAQPQVAFGGENMRLQSASVSPTGAAWNVGLVMANDNGNSSLPTSYRRWWHCQIGNLAPSGETLHVAVSNAGYSDVILPVWSLSTDGIGFAPWTRVPVSATPSISGSTHRFTLQPPPGTVALRLAKYFPYTVTDKDAFLAGITGHPSGRVRSVTSLGTTAQGRPIQLVEMTDPSVPDSGKRRVWIHAGIHPAENTSYFVLEGLIAFLLSADPYAGLLLSNAIVDIVPMANPDGVFAGNYRTNGRSANLEDLWGSPYNNTEREIVALRARIETFMGNAASPGANPIELVLNLHSSHNVSFPFHYRHVSNPSWSAGNNSGVLPAVNALEGRWINDLEARSAFVNRGTTQSSSCGAPARPFVECMMHDRWSSVPSWFGPPANLPQVMAITLEGTYGLGPDGATWNTGDDYRQVGRETGLALADYFGLQLTTSITAYGPACGGLTFAGSMSGASVASLTMAGAPPTALGWLVLGSGQSVIALPPPWTCDLLTPPLLSVPVTISSRGVVSLDLTIPPISGLAVDMQGVTANIVGPNAIVATSNGLEIQNRF